MELQKMNQHILTNQIREFDSAVLEDKFINLSVTL